MDERFIKAVFTSPGENAFCWYCLRDFVAQEEALVFSQRGQTIPYKAVCNDDCLEGYRELLKLDNGDN